MGGRKESGQPSATKGTQVTFACLHSGIIQKSLALASPAPSIVDAFVFHLAWGAGGRRSWLRTQQAVGLMSVSAPCEHALTVVIHFPACPMSLELNWHWQCTAVPPQEGRGLLCAELVVPLPNPARPCGAAPNRNP